MLAQIDTNGTGAQMPTEKYGVMSPFHAGGGAEVAVPAAVVPQLRCSMARRTPFLPRIRLR